MICYEGVEQSGIFMKRVIFSALALFAAATAADAATIVNLDGKANASMDGATAVALTLGPGTYSIAPLDSAVGIYTAFNRFSAVGDCDAAGANCRQGWEHSYKVTIGSTTFGFGDGNGNGGLGPLNPGNGYYDSAAHAFANAAPVANAFTLGAISNVKFWILDDYLGDNSGGISLSVTGAGGVPEPGTWSLLIAGFGMIGAVLRRRRGPLTA